jgi:acyl transferase domain-containing protein/NAD(P)-dependent dehydrogenase (short-subunit alcohol dehydrogenase family)
MRLSDKNHVIAVIGMGCLFPEAPDLKSYLQLLVRGKDAISDIPSTHWSPSDYFDEDPHKPDRVYCKRGGFLPPIDFDPVEYGVPPASLEATDTSQLLGLICAKAALADAADTDNRPLLRQRTSVILGVTGTQELVIPLSSRLGHPIWLKALRASGIPPETAREIVTRISDAYVPWQEDSFPGLLGNVVAGRISNRLDLGGTNCVVDAACASSLSAVHLAVMELASGRSDRVVTGGVDTLNDIFMHMCFSKTHVLSRTGDARPFSKDADGTVLGEGIGMLVLKRLEDAERDHDRIYALIRAIGSSSDAKSQSIYAPRVEGQVRALENAYRHAGVEPDTVDLLEAHGTGTRVGDRVEFQALRQVFGSGKRHCAVGSVKSMIGHTKAAAGAAGLIKAALSLYHNVLPPTLKVEAPDPNLGIEESPFYLNTELRPWLNHSEHPRRAGVSAFGFGGSNFHVVLEEYQPAKERVCWDGAVEIIALSAPERSLLLHRLEESNRQLHSGEPISLIAHRTRKTFSHKDPYRILIPLEMFRLDGNPAGERLASLLTEACDLLSTGKEERLRSIRSLYYGNFAAPGGMAFMFPGQGSQYVGMGRDLVCMFPEAFSVLERAGRIFGSEHRLGDLIYPIPSYPEKPKSNLEQRLRSTDIAQPAVGALDLAWFNVLSRFGLSPDAFCGHSFGEIIALCAAGWIEPDAALMLSVFRGKYMAAAGSETSGTMLAVSAPLSQIESLVDGKSDLILSNRNSPTQGILSGTCEAIEAAEERCRRLGFQTRRLPVSAAFHTRFMRAACTPFRERLDTIVITPTEVPVFSNRTGKPYPRDAEHAKTLLCEQIVHPIDFIGDVFNLYEFGIRTFVEVGPRSVLTGLIGSTLSNRTINAFSVDASNGKDPGIVDLAKTLCRLAALGYPVDLNRWEEPVAEPEKSRFSIPLVGTNYRRLPEPNPIRKPECKPECKIDPCSGAKDSNSDLPVPQSFLHRLEESSINQESEIPMEKEGTKNTGTVSEALRIAREGLKSLQQLQMQTAEAHQKFLETQSVATRALQEMMADTRRLTSMLTEGIKYSNPAESEPLREERNPAPAERVMAPPEKKTDPSPSRSLLPIESIVRDVVSRLTGYPAEMLEMNMDIEADLGIDSIKRVEILSALEEALPGIEKVPPEVMGSLKRLGQIADYVGISHRAGPSVSDPVESESDPVRGETVELPEPQLAGASARDKISDTLRDVVSRLTGYPAEMLEMNMDIEADLGIDSIKRVEILSTLEEALPGTKKISPEEMGGLKTLGQIAGFLAQQDLKEHPVSIEKPLSKRPDMEADEASLKRYRISVLKRVFQSGDSVRLPKERVVFVTSDGPHIPDKHGDLAEALVKRFDGCGIPAAVIDADRLAGDGIKGNRPEAAGLIILPGIELPLAFSLARMLGPELLESAARGGALFSTVSRMDGKFGFSGRGFDDPMQGGLAGLIKTANLEWPKVCCRAFDICPGWKQTEAIASTIVKELVFGAGGGPVEIGLDETSRYHLNLTPEGRNGRQEPLKIAPGDLIVVTGGGRGITAAASRILGEANRPTLLLLGRSPQPASEPDWLTPLTEAGEMKKAILEHEFSGVTPTPLVLEMAFHKYSAARAVLSNLEGIKKTGAAVFYRSVDIRNLESVQEVISEFRSLHGPVRGIVHGAGVVKDRWIVDKTEDQFRTVFDTKVAGILNLLEATRKDPLQYLVFFSSVAGRLGNKGQSDYAMANEVLNKIAQQEAFKRPGCKVISINWGPWDGGMVVDSLKKKFKKQGVSLISMDAGARAMLSEMKSPEGPVEVVIGDTALSQTDESERLPELSHPKDSNTVDPDPLSLAFIREIDLDHYPILRSHVLDGKPVIPLALIAEWLSIAALHQNPGFVLHGLDDLRVLKGIRLEGDKKEIRLLAANAKKEGDAFRVAVELRDGTEENREVVHSSAKAVLVDSFPDPPPYVNGAVNRNSCLRPIQEVYRDLLFHGDQLHGIEDILCCSPTGMTARIRSAPSPDRWMRKPLRSRWVLDPLVLDSAFQMATIWCFEEKGMVSLPSFCQSYRQYFDSFPPDGVTAVLNVTDATDRKISGDFVFLDASDHVVARMTGYEAVMDAALIKAFRSQTGTDSYRR